MFGKIYQNPNFNGDLAIECFSILATYRRFDIAMHVGTHLLKACDKLVINLES